jgi:putative intracellular protease/amidase
MEKFTKDYAALLLVGGSGPIVDMVNNQRVQDLILGFYHANKPIAAECYGVACLAFARDYHLRKSILWGKHVTGHPLEYDYKDGTGFMGVDFNMGPPPYPLEFILRDATGPDGAFHGNVGRKISALVDYPFITGRSTADSYKTGELLVAVLEKGLKRYGW